MRTTERLEDLMSAIRTMHRLAAIAREGANSELYRFCGLREKYLKKARLRDKAAVRLAKALARECDRIKEEYNAPPKVTSTDLPRLEPISTQLLQIHVPEWEGCQ